MGVFSKLRTRGRTETGLQDAQLSQDKSGLLLQLDREGLAQRVQAIRALATAIEGARPAGEASPYFAADPVLDADMVPLEQVAPVEPATPDLSEIVVLQPNPPQPGTLAKSSSNPSAAVHFSKILTGQAPTQRKGEKVETANLPPAVDGDEGIVMP